MYILYSNYYTLFIILSILFFKYHALENNLQNFNSPSLDLTQNDLSSRNFVNLNSLVHSVGRNSENKYFIKRQAGGNEKEKKQKSAPKKVSKTKVPGKKPLPSKPNPKLQVRKTTTIKIKKKPNTTKKPVTTTKKTIPNKTTQKITKSTSTVTTTRKRVTKPKTTKTTTKSTTTTTEPEKFPHLIPKVINDINELRKKHHAPKLTVNNTLVKQTRIILSDLENRHNGIYTKFVGMLEDFDVVDPRYNPLVTWAEGEERVNYDKFNEKTVPEEFAQLVWASTRSIGCGYIIQEANELIIFICLFYPKGNIPGKYKENVLKP
uniref:SCP domain-containing protein n=1 Tax=Strongyloides venezuelensis TaxID=75913 RepID=A0A0K0F422_STRVS